MPRQTVGHNPVTVVLREIKNAVVEALDMDEVVLARDERRLWIIGGVVGPACFVMQLSQHRQKPVVTPSHTLFAGHYREPVSSEIEKGVLLPAAEDSLM